MTISLDKRAAAVRISLDKHQIRKPPIMRVGLAYDVSGSAKSFYYNGHIQQTNDRLLGVAANFDDNGEMDVWVFDNKSRKLETAKAGDYGDYVDKEILPNVGGMWNGTSYAPVMQDIVDFFFKPTKAKKSGGFFGFGGRAKEEQPFNADVPAFVMFVTDGVNDDKAATERVLRDSQKYGIYWSLVGVGNPSEFGFLQKMADDLPNVGFTNLSSLNVSDETLYDEIICEELCEWIKKPHHK